MSTTVRKQEIEGKCVTNQQSLVKICFLNYYGLSPIHIKYDVHYWISILQAIGCDINIYPFLCLQFIIF